jgi:hypothetical protein
MNSNILHHVRAKTPGPQGKGEARGRFFPQACFFTSDLASTGLAFSCILLRTSQRGPAINAVQHRFHEAELLQMARSGSPAASTLSTTSAVLPTAMFSRFRRLLERVGITHVSPSVRRCCIQLPICRFADHYPPVSVARFEPQSLLTPLRSSTERTRPGSPRSLQPRSDARSTARPFG